MSRLRYPRRNDDRGVTIVMLALLLVVLMIFAAFAVDIGMLANERRQDQSAVDASALSSAVIALQGGNLQGVVNEVLSKATFDVGRTITNQQWIACTDPQADRPDYTLTAASLGLTPATQCISWTADFYRMRVRLPDQVVNTAFARVLGIDTLTARAIAEVEFVPRTEGGAALPFIALSSAATGQHICIRTNSSGNPPTQMVGNGPGNLATPGVGPAAGDPCDAAVYDPGSSTFGTLTPRDYRGSCDTQNTNVMAAIMEGADHPTGFFTDPPFTIPNNGDSSDSQTQRESTDGDVRVDGPGPTCTTFMPNTIQMNSGLSAQDLRCALVSPHSGPAEICSVGGRNLVPRLQRGTQQDDVFVGEDMDNTPPWAYLTASSNLPDSCKDLRTAHQTNNLTWDFYDRREAFMQCLSQWNQNTHDQLFTDAMGTAPRFAYVPQIAERQLCETQDLPPFSPCGAALQFAHVNSYVPIYLNKVYANQGNNQLGCEPLDLRPHSWYMHEAGQVFLTNCGPNNATIDRLTAFVFDCQMLPETVCDPALLPGIPGNQGSTTSIYDSRLFR